VYRDEQALKAPSPAAAAAPLFSTVTVSSPTPEKAKEVASRLVADKLAASVSIIPAVQTVYSWRGEVRMDDETLLVCKTRTALVDELVKMVELLSGRGEIPEVVAAHVVGGSQEYLSFILEGTKEP